MERTHNERLNDLTIQKLAAEVELTIQESITQRKKNRWFEVTIALTIFAAGIAFAKLFI